LKKKLLGKDVFLIKEVEGKKEFVKSFTEKDDLINYLKDNIPLLNEKENFVIDPTLPTNQKLFLKLSAEKAAAYQKKNGFDIDSYETKQEVAKVFSDEKISLEQKSEKLFKSIEIYTGDDEEKKLSMVLAEMLAEYSVEIYTQIFGPLDDPTNKNGENANERILQHLRNSLNVLISKDYTQHLYKGSFVVDLIVLRNNISRIFMNKQNRLNKLKNKKS
jgi:hypothetical protein